MQKKMRVYILCYNDKKKIVIQGKRCSNVEEKKIYKEDS